MKIIKIVAVAALALAGCVSVNSPKESGTSYVADAIAPWVEKDSLSGAISIL